MITLKISKVSELKLKNTCIKKCIFKHMVLDEL